jgi:hypothetical protein
MRIKNSIFGATLASVWLSACGGGSAIHFVPSAVYAGRSSSICNVANPPFMDGDFFTLEIRSDATPVLSSSFSLDFTTPVPPAGTPVPLSVSAPEGIDTSAYPSYADQTAINDTIGFAYTRGSNASEIDAGAFDGVTITIVSLPAKEGDPLAVELAIHFVDGRRLDQTFSAPVTTTVNTCQRG